MEGVHSEAIPAPKLVSIGLTTRNRAATLPRAIESLLAQRYPRIELIISDNASTDGTRGVAEEFARRDPRVRYVRQRENIGAFGNFNFVLQQARGGYFMWAGDDDSWHPDFISDLVAALGANPACGVAMSSLRRVGQDGAPIDEVVFAGDRNLTGRGYSVAVGRMMELRTPYHLVLYGLFRTALLRSLFRKTFPRCIAPDRVLMCEVAAATKIFLTPDVRWEKTVSANPVVERFEDEQVRETFLNRFRRTRFVGAIIARLVASPSIPLARKLALLPVHIPRLLWRNRGYMLHELSPRVAKWCMGVRPARAER